MTKIQKCKELWAVDNGFSSWNEFASKFRQLNSSPPDAIICIPETIINELLEIAIK
jgi:hypothetical protein